MGINVGDARVNANRLNEDRQYLENAKRKMITYRNQISSSWEGKEVPHILRAVDRTIASINTAMREMEGLSSDVVRVADQIRSEELAAERRRQDDLRRHQEEERRRQQEEEAGRREEVRWQS